MNLKIKNIQYGIAPFGPASGMAGIYASFEETEEDVDLFESYKQSIKDNNLINQYINSIDGSQGVYLFFEGGVIEKNENSDIWDKFAEALSKEAVKTQVDLKIKGPNMRPPFMIWVGVPKVFSSIRNFYQHFNVAMGVIKKGQDYSILALQEITNHQFGRVSIIYDQDYKLLVEFLSKITSKVRTLKIEIVDDSSDVSAAEEVILLCMKNGIRYYETPSIDSKYRLSEFFSLKE